MRDYEFRAALGCFKALAGGVGGKDKLPEHMVINFVLVIIFEMLSKTTTALENRHLALWGAGRWDEYSYQGGCVIGI
jgi:hypothetical protein